MSKKARRRAAIAKGRSPQERYALYLHARVADLASLLREITAPSASAAAVREIVALLPPFGGFSPTPNRHITAPAVEPIEAKRDVAPLRLSHERAPLAPKTAAPRAKPKSYDCICAECGAAFESPQYVRKFCGFTCHGDGARRRSRELWLESRRWPPGARSAGVA